MSNALVIPDPMPANGYRQRSPWQKLALLLATLVLSFSLSSCQAGNDTMGLDVVGYNHTDEDIGWFTVGNGGGGYLGKHEGGGGFVCCVSIPRQYKPGMTLTVNWGGVARKTQERVVEVPPYTPKDGGAFAVHFFHNGDVKVFVTMHLPYPVQYTPTDDETKM